jgi:hypothetical protein
MATSIPSPTYQERAAEKRASQLALIPPEWRLSPVPLAESHPDALAYIRRILTPAELALTEQTDITVLLRRLSSAELSSLELTRAFAKRAALAHQLTTCCTEIFFEEAFATAKQMDEYLAKTGATFGPLHGLPVSIKDLFSVKGVDTSIGRKPTIYQLPFYFQYTHHFSRMGRSNQQPRPRRQIRSTNPPPPRRSIIRQNQPAPINDDVRLVQPRLRAMRQPAESQSDFWGQFWRRVLASCGPG